MPKKKWVFFLIILLILPFYSCSKKHMGWGVLLWVIDNPAIPSGTVLPVQVRSNIEQSWITGIPEGFETDSQAALIPLPHLEFFKSKRAAEKYAAAFAECALLYAETLQDGLPIREKPENGARRTYRLKEGEIVKLINKVEGTEAISTTGAPLEGYWYKVLTYSGSTGYCFSYRLRIFEHSTGPLGDAPVQVDTSGDRDLEIVLSRIWYPESYKKMIDSGRLDLEVLSKNYSFTSGIANGRARIYLEKDVSEFSYQKISKTGNRSWNFAGTSLNVILHSDSMLEVQWEDENKINQSEKFVTLQVPIESLVNQEREKRQNKLQSLYNRGPGFVSANYGNLIFTANGNFTWDEFKTLPENMITNSMLGTGNVDIDYSLSGEMLDRYTDAFGLRFNAVGGNRRTLVFAYTLDNQGLRLEYIPSDYLSGRTVTRRSPSPFVIYFSAGH